MIRTTTMGLLFLLFMMLGMKEPTSQTSCSLNCSTTCLMMFLQPSPEYRPLDGGMDHIRGQGRKRPDRMAPDGDGRNRPMPQNMVEHIMAVAKEIDPELASKLSAMCEKDPDSFDKIIRRQGHRLGSLVRLREEDPELFEVKVTELKTDAEIYHVAESLRGQDYASPNAKAQIAELEGLVRVKTAISIRAQTLYIERLERHLEGLQARLVDTSARFDEIVDERLEQLLHAVGDEQAKQPPQRD